MRLIVIPVFTIVALSIIGSNNRCPGQFILDIKVPPGEYDSIGCYFSKDSLAAYNLWMFEWEYFDSTGNIHMKVDRDEITWVFITLFSKKYKGANHKMKSRVFLLAQPGKAYQVEYDSTYPILFKIEGDNKEAQNFYNKYSHSNVNDLRGSWTTNTDSLPNDLLQHLEDSIQHTSFPFIQLHNNGKIDQEYYSTVITQIQNAHIKGFMNHLRLRQVLYKEDQMPGFAGAIPLKISDPEFIKIMEEVYTTYPLSNPNIRMAPDLNQNIEFYLYYRLWTDKTINPLTDSIVNWPCGSYAEIMRKIDLAEKYLDEDLIEQYFAHQFGSAPLNTGPDSLATFLYPEFKKRYPNSEYFPGIQRNILDLTGFYTSFYPGLEEDNNADASKIHGPSYVFSPDICFIDKQDTISGLKSLLKIFQGKNLYVDFWASWCPPCQYEFRFKDSVQNYLNDLGIDMLYISTDADEAKWYNTISNHNLKGYHYRVSNAELKQEIDKLVYFIPTFWIVDSTGHVIDYDAESPHTKSRLYEQLTNSFKKGLE
ncbi:MAG: TlpA disulfide reductase family protein [Bacteroidota bacterium]